VPFTLVHNEKHSTEDILTTCTRTLMLPLQFYICFWTIITSNYCKGCELKLSKTLCPWYYFVFSDL